MFTGIEVTQYSGRNDEAYSVRVLSEFVIRGGYT